VAEERVVRDDIELNIKIRTPTADRLVEAAKHL